MAVLHPTKRFAKCAAKLGHQEQARLAKSVKQFLADPRHPSLHFEKLSTGYYTFRVDMNFRVALRRNDDGSYNAVDVDDHTKIYQAYG